MTKLLSLLAVLLLLSGCGKPKPAPIKVIVGSCERIVSPLGDDASDGSWEHPMLTITHAMNSIPKSCLGPERVEKMSEDKGILRSEGDTWVIEGNSDSSLLVQSGGTAYVTLDDVSFSDEMAQFYAHRMFYGQTFQQATDDWMNGQQDWDPKKKP